MCAWLQTRNPMDSLPDPEGCTLRLRVARDHPGTRTYVHTYIYYIYRQGARHVEFDR